MAGFKEGTHLRFEGGTYVNFTQACRDCKKYYQIFRIDIDNCYDENGKNIVANKDLYEKFSFSCKKCGLLNFINFSELCNEKTVLYLRKIEREKREKEKKEDNL